MPDDDDLFEFLLVEALNEEDEDDENDDDDTGDNGDDAAGGSANREGNAPRGIVGKIVTTLAKLFGG